MARSIFAIVEVLCGAVFAALVYGVVFGIVSATMLEPSFDRGLTFGLTFGIAAGALIAAYAAEAERGASFTARLIPWLTALALLAVAGNLLFAGGGWEVVFEGSRGLATATVVLWLCTTVWLTSEVAR